ncbi:hypothetical protein BJP34_02020 [Moorena producens PAL-8-15-08-1]|uniref:Surface-adhesin protein E-like domain-containing protein n=2 Tax=Moorena TaxID=1155738 RepID=A0A1D8TLA6_9CYAN|nr:hypothetical protein BJP34_02020 [Moorena producens PAL-8-15-08-1]
MAAFRAVTVDTKLILNSLILLLVNSMGKFLLILSAIACLCQTAIAQTQSRRWIRVMSNAQTGNIHYFDVDSLVSTTDEMGNPIHSFDSRIVFGNPLEPGVYSAIITVQVNCPERSIRTSRFEQYDSQGSIISREESENDWYTIPMPDTPTVHVMNGFHTLACKSKTNVVNR